MPNIQIMPSILAADFGRLAEGCELAAKAGADQIHVDVMDGRFVPNISFGPNAVKMAKVAVNIPRNVHLMITHPKEHLQAFTDAGSDTITIHVEAQSHVAEALIRIRKLGKRAGISLNPASPIEMILPHIENNLVDEVLIMTVNPGFGGQAFMPDMVEKIATVRRLSDSLDISVDGGINDKTICSAAAAGANLFVAGSFLFKHPNMKTAISSLREIAQQHYCKAL